MLHVNYQLNLQFSVIVFVDFFLYLFVSFDFIQLIFLDIIFYVAFNYQRDGKRLSVYCHFFILISITNDLQTNVFESGYGIVDAFDAYLFFKDFQPMVRGQW